MMYKSPIEIIRRDMQINIENAIMSAVQEVGVTVDKEELIKALAHDRDSYNQGYQDAVAAMSEALVDCIYCKHSGKCQAPLEEGEK